jgi:arginase
MNLAIIGVPFNSAGSDTAEALAAAALRSAGLIETLAAGHDVADFGDVTIEPPLHRARDRESGLIAPDSLAGMIAAVRVEVGRAYEKDRVPVLVGGDCPILLGGLLGARDRLGYSPALLFVDGHEDAYEPQKSLTGEAADVELGLAVGFTRLQGADPLARELPVVDPHEVVLLGPRDRAQVESEGHKSVGSRVIVLDDTELRAAGIEMTVKRWLDQFQHKPGRFWFHLDWDVLSSEDMPAVSYPQPGGLAWDELAEIARAALHADHLIGIDLTVYNPDLDLDAAAAGKIVSFLQDVTTTPERTPRLGRI